MAGSLAPVMYLRSETEQLPNQAVMQPVRMLSMVQLYPFEDLVTHDKSFQSPEGE